MIAAPPLVQTLPFVAWILLTTLAFGSFVFVVVTRQLTDATRGYVRVTAVSAGVLALLALGVDGSLVGSSDLVVKNPVPSGPLNTVLLIFVVVAVVYGFTLGSRRLSVALGAIGCLVAVVVLARAALGWAPTQADAVPFLVQLAVLSLATGGSMAAIVLGHWYLVTPKISERPLILQCRLLLAVLISQASLFVTWTTLGGGPGQTAFSAFTSGPVLLVILRLLVTIVFPIALVWMAWRTALTRSMESATGLLYINFAAVLAGTIGAGAMYVASGILV
jgi:hypothetical protein